MPEIEKDPKQDGRRRRDWIQTYMGKRFYPLDPRPEDVILDDIAHALSNLCRFTGHCSRFYSVAEHSVYVSKLLPIEGNLALWGLLHDAAEAYTGDVNARIKDYIWVTDEFRLVPFQRIEDDLLFVIAEGLHIPFPKKEGWEHIKKADVQVFKNEVLQLLPLVDPDWKSQVLDKIEAPEIVIHEWTPEQACKRFIDRYIDLSNLFREDKHDSC